MLQEAFGAPICTSRTSRDESGICRSMAHTQRGAGVCEEGSQEVPPTVCLKHCL